MTREIWVQAAERRRRWSSRERCRVASRREIDDWCLLAALGLWVVGTALWWGDVADPSYEVRQVGTYVFLLGPAVLTLLPLFWRSHRRSTSIVSAFGLAIWCVWGAYFGALVYVLCIPCLILAAVFAKPQPAGLHGN